MGNLTPGATLIYERSNGIIYSREMGADPQDRLVVGYENAKDYNPLVNNVQENELWHQIRSAAKTNTALQEALDCVKVIYELSKSE
jgi:hypothetical protein